VFVCMSMSLCVRGYLRVHISLCDSVGVEIVEHKPSFPGRNVKHARGKVDSMKIFIEFKELIILRMQTSPFNIF